MPTKSMEDWINNSLRRDIGYHKEWQETVVAHQVRHDELSYLLDAAWAATRAPFIVADLETTGLNAATNEILEFGAVQASADDEIEAEFSMLVRPNEPVPLKITRLTGITQELVDRKGQPLTEALKAFLEFVGTRPIFFHNAPFDTGFLKNAAVASNSKFINPVHDALPMARSAWPSLESHKLQSLAEFVGAPVPPNTERLLTLKRH